MKKITAIATALLIMTSTSTYADESEKKSCEANGINYSQAKEFVSTLKTALKENDKATVAELISYPLKIHDHSKKYIIKTKSNFLTQYGVIFNKEHKTWILNEKEIFCNYQGAMLAGGFVWFETTDKGAKIFVININS